MKQAVRGVGVTDGDEMVGRYVRAAGEAGNDPPRSRGEEGNDSAAYVSRRPWGAESDLSRLKCCGPGSWVDMHWYPCPGRWRVAGGGTETPFVGAVRSRGEGGGWSALIAMIGMETFEEER